MRTTGQDEGFTAQLKDFFVDFGSLARFTGKVIRELFKKTTEFREFLRQAYYVGYKSLPLVGITAFILGLVLTLQTRPVMADLGAEAWLPGMVIVSIIREIGPVITALIFTGRVASGFGAELSSMRVTEQIDAMEVSGINPVKYLVVTRVMAATLMVPVLVIYSDGIAFIGSFFGVNIQSSITFQLFLKNAFDSVHFYDIIPATIKTFFFGFAIGVISCYKGYYTDRGTAGVGLAANSAVVSSSLAVFVIDLIVVQLTELII
ncbi:MAG: ABC transporter permease [Bacteroidales bacterium]|nr:ABC transporter permease [Bacteroidales bacterium]